MHAASKPMPLVLVRWLARILGIMAAGLTGVFFIAHLGEFIAGDALPPFGAWTSMALLLVITASYPLAWKFEATGAIMAIAGSLLLFIRADEYFLLYFGVMSFPAVLHLICRFWPEYKESKPVMHSPTKRIVMSAAVAVPLALAGLFVLELFTHHGTPYTAETLPEALAGTWRGTGVVYVDPDTNEPTTAEVSITVHPDGSVTGMVDNTPIIEAEAQKNRNWLYRKINFYTDYIIEGTLGGELEPGDGLNGCFLRIPCNIKDGALRGTIFHITRWSYDPIVNRLALTREEDSRAP